MQTQPQPTSITIQIPEPPIAHYPDSNQLVVGVFGLTGAVILMIGVFVYCLILKRSLLAQGKT